MTKSFGFGLLITSSILLAACSGDEPVNRGHASGLGGAASEAEGPELDAGNIPLDGAVVVADCDMCDGFPAGPVFDGSAPTNSADLFQGDAGSSGPCIAEPQDGALMPSNWLRPRVEFTTAGGEDLFELRFSIDNQINDLVVYTTNRTWTMPAGMWEVVRQQSAGQRVSLSIRAVRSTGGQVQASSSTFEIAPMAAEGSIVFWTTSGGTSLNGFQVGEEGVVEALRGDDWVGGGGGDKCIGCHTSTPDGKHAAFTVALTEPEGGLMGIGLASVEEETKGEEPDFLTPEAAQNIASGSLSFKQWVPWKKDYHRDVSLRRRGLMAFSPQHWAPGDRIMVAQVGDRLDAELIWFDLEATSTQEGEGWGVLDRKGDQTDAQGHQGAGAPTWTHTPEGGDRIVYVSSPSAWDGRLGSDNGDDTDLHSIPFNNRQGGDATPVLGASTPEWHEYYPAFSADDEWLAFNRIARTDKHTDPKWAGFCADQQGCMYGAPTAEVFILPSEGGTPIRLAANDPPACTGKTSPGVKNSWPKWSPEVLTDGEGKKYYWMMFSSTRRSDNVPQIYLAAIVVDGEGVTSYPALHLWNQAPSENNHTPAWDVFKIPPVVIK